MGGGFALFGVVLFCGGLVVFGGGIVLFCGGIVMFCGGIGHVDPPVWFVL